MSHGAPRGRVPLATELMAGQVDVSNSTLPPVLGQIQTGTLRAIGLASPGRNRHIPDVPTLRERGITDADMESWTAFFAPARAPAPASASPWTCATRRRSRRSRRPTCAGSRG